MYNNRVKHFVPEGGTGDGKTMVELGCLLCKDWLVGALRVVLKTFLAASWKSGSSISGVCPLEQR
jgi:hypothetical protein